MNDVAIHIAGLGKQYQIGAAQKTYRTIRDSLTTAVSTPYRRVRNVLRGEAALSQHDIFWALRDISFDIRQGEVVGIIGHNGAGKSTLLKLLSRITEPSEGYAEIHGRVGALLEVGTGFHPELTGRENIYLNGAILGMRRGEIDSKLDSIVQFAGVERFLETAVKHYSSGMALRLGFSIAAHLDLEILIVDEVLAVGDLEFQRRCLGKMSEVAQSGRTVLFVSHNMTAISSLTTRAVILKQGHIILDGPTQDVIPAYLQSSAGSFGSITWEKGERPGDEHAELISCQVGNGSQSEFPSHEAIPITIKYAVLQPCRDLRIGFELTTNEGVLLFRAYADDMKRSSEPTEPGEYEAVCIIPPYLLNEGLHFVSFRANIHAVKHIVILNNLISFQVVNLFGSNSVYGIRRPGVINPILQWTVTNPEGNIQLNGV